jgi:nicotinate-nucleotide adenylyltransferase
VKIGIYGGTFDPIHNGHLILGRDAIEYLELDRLMFVPNLLSPHKQGSEPAPQRLRYQMVAAALAPEPAFEASDWEIQRRPPSYTIDTVLHIKEQFGDCDLFYLVGEDNLTELHTWRRIDELLQLVTFVVLSRGTSDAVHPYITLKRRIDISATEIRQRVAQGKSVRYFVPDPVLTIIQENKLYQEAGS